MVRMRRETSKLDDEIFVEVCRARSIDPAAQATDCATGPVARASEGATTNSALSEALFALPKSGRVSPIYRTARGWEMVQLIRVIAPLTGGLDAARPIVVSGRSVMAAQRLLQAGSRSSQAGSLRRWMRRPSRCSARRGRRSQRSLQPMPWSRGGTKQRGWPKVRAVC
jgi:hypothetical protein